MDQPTLVARPRPAGNPRQLRRSGLVPAVLYGPGQPTQHLAVPEKDLTRLVGSGRHSLLRLRIEGGEEGESPVMVKELQTDPVSRQPLHVDFVRVAQGEKLRTTVPLRLEGEGRLSQTGGILQHQLHELAVECLPAQLPDEIVVDLSGLHIGDTLTVSDLSLPEGVRVLDEPATVVLTVLAPRGGAAAAEAGEAAPGGAEAGGEAESE